MIQKCLGVPFLVSLFLWISISSFTACDDEVQQEIPLEESGYPDRTVLLYIIGDNSLSRYADRNIDSIMAGIGRIHTTLNMLVYEDDYDDVPVLWKIERNKRGEVMKIPVKSYPEQDSADPEIMESILKEVFRTYPAKEKGLFLWSHGSGWLPSSKFVLPAGKKRAFGPDYTTFLEIWDLRNVLTNTEIHFDFLVFDACMMGSVEVAYELRYVTDYLIASPAEIMGLGFPYQLVIPVLGRTELDLPGVCDAYMTFYNGNSGRDGTISLIRTERLEALADCYGAILQEKNMDELSDRVIQQMGRRIPFSTTDYRNIFYDLGDLVDNLVTPLAGSFRQEMERVVLQKRNTPRFETFEIVRNSGLTVFIPELNTTDRYLQAYPYLQWYQATRQASSSE